MRVSIKSSSFWSLKFFVKTKRDDLKPFLDTNIPIFCIIGPLKCGKNTIGHLLAECTEYRILLQKDQRKNSSRFKIRTVKTSAREMVESFAEEINQSYRFCQGYIIIDFPKTVKEAKLFEKEIKVPNAIIHSTLPLDALLARAVAHEPDSNLNDIRMTYIEEARNCRKIEKKYESRTVKVISYYPPEDVINKVLVCLEDEFGYKFRRLVAKDNFFKTLNPLQ